MPIKTKVQTIPSPTAKTSWSGKMVTMTYFCVGLAVILIAAQFWLYGLRFQRLFPNDVWQAVTLTNGQTYFGKLEKYGPHTLVLFEVYYLQAKSDEATSDTADTTADETTNNDSGLKLIKLTDDFHRPNNYLIINRDQVLFWQHLANESPIVEAIQKNN